MFKKINKALLLSAIGGVICEMIIYNAIERYETRRALKRSITEVLPDGTEIVHF